MDSKKKKELLSYYWEGEPVYHPTEGVPKPAERILKARLLAITLLAVYLGFGFGVLQVTSGPSFIYWVTGIPLGVFVADFLSGLTHIYIDFGTSNRKNAIHKRLFLSRVHHHELMRPAKLDYASLWFFPALHSFLLLALLPLLFLVLIPQPKDLSRLAPFWLSLLWFSSVSQVSHAYAHGKAKLPLTKKVVRLLQRLRILVPPRVHARHHREIDENFCVLNGWANPLVNFIFKRLIESRIPEATSPERQKADMKRNLAYPYEEIL